MTASPISTLNLRHLSFAALTTLSKNGIRVIDNFLNFNQSGLALSARQADRVLFTGSEQPAPGDLIFFDTTLRDADGHMALVQIVRNNGIVLIQEVQGDRTVWTNGTYFANREIDLHQNPPYPGYGAVLGWLRLKL